MSGSNTSPSESVISEDLSEASRVSQTRVNTVVNQDADNDDDMGEAVSNQPRPDDTSESEPGGEREDEENGGEESGDKPETKPQKPQPKYTEAHKRVQESLASKYAAERMAEQAYNRAQAAEKALAELRVKLNKEYDNQADYINAQVQGATSQARVEQAQEAAREAEQAIMTASKAAWQTACEQAQTRIPELYDKLMAGKDTTPITPIMAEAFIDEGEYGPDVALYLVENPSEAQRISKLSPVGQVSAIARLGARFAMRNGVSEPTAKKQEAEKAKPAPKVTQAPTPPKTLKTGSTPRKPTLATVDDMEEYDRLRANGTLK